MGGVIGCGSEVIQSDEGHVNRTSTCSSINPEPLNHHTQLYENRERDKSGIHIHMLETEINLVTARKLMCVYICMYVYMYIYIYVCVCVCVYNMWSIKYKYILN